MGLNNRPEEFTALLKREYAPVAQVVQSAGIKPGMIQRIGFAG